MRSFGPCPPRFASGPFARTCLWGSSPGLLIFIAGRRPHGDAQQLREQIRPLHLSHVVDEKPARRTRTPEPGRIAAPQCCGLERAWPHQRLSWQNVVKGFMKIESPLSIETPGSGGSSMSCGVGAAGAGGRGTVCDATRPDSTHAREFREDDQEAANPVKCKAAKEWRLGWVCSYR